MFQVDPTKTSAVNLIAMINSGATVIFTGTEFSVSAPSEFDPVDVGDVTNTKITLTALEGTGYKGTREPHYVRLTMGATRPGAFLTWSIDSTITRAALIALVLDNHKLLASDVTFTGLEGGMPAAGASGTLTMTAVDGSYFYIGTVDLTINNTDAP